MSDRYINASEIGDFVYCQRAWWYKLHGAINGNVHHLKRGEQAHIHLANHVVYLDRHIRLGRYVLIGLLCLILGLAIFYLLK